MYINRQRVKSLILSSQISADPQRREFHGGDTVQLTFNIGMVWADSNMKCMCTYIHFGRSRDIISMYDGLCSGLAVLGYLYL